jgi:hypothetical protein
VKANTELFRDLLLININTLETMALIYNDHSRKYRAGFRVWDRPDTVLSDIIIRQQEIAKMPDGKEKQAALEKLKKDNFSPTRIYVGRNVDEESEVTLSDSQGNDRIKMSVTADGNAKLDFLDANGKVIYSLPKDAKPKEK